MFDDISTEEKEEAIEFLLAIADDEYFAGHRLGMWLAVSPTLEEDNTLTSIAQDELGHARLWYDIVSEHRSDTTDELAIYRSAEDRRNTILVEREHQDFADTITRNYLYDEAEWLYLESLRDGQIPRISDTASVALNEEPFHLEHANKWLEVLSTTEETIERLEAAFETNLQAAADLFRFDDELLLDAGVLARPPSELAMDWEVAITKTLSELPIDVHGEDVSAVLTDRPETNGRDAEHTDDLRALIMSMRPREIERI